MSFGIAISSLANRIRMHCASLDNYICDGAFAKRDSMTIADLDASKKLLANCMNEIDRRRAELIANTPKDMVA